MSRTGQEFFKSSAFMVVMFLVLSFLTASFLAFNIPPLQNPDEYAHYVRAEQLSRGKWGVSNYAEVITRGTGGDVPAALVKLNEVFSGVSGNSDQKVSEDRIASGHELRWGGDIVNLRFMVSYIYSPVFYIPSAIGISIGKAFDADLVNTLVMARMANAIFCIGIAALALGIVRRGRYLLYTILLFPMTLSLMAACTQDGLILSVGALVVALISRCSSKERTAAAPGWGSGVASLLLVPFVMSRAPYLLFSILILLCRPLRWTRWAFLALPIAIGAIWHALFSYALSQAYIHLGIGLSDQQNRHFASKFMYITEHPLNAVMIVIDTFREMGVFYLESVVGVLGWLDVYLPTWYYMLMALIFLSATLLSLGDPRVAARQPMRILDGLVFLAVVPGTVLGILFSLYLVESPVGDTVARGVQGRYFLPVAMAIALFLPCLPKLQACLSGWKGRSLEAAVLLIPSLSFLITMQHVSSRYYLP